MKFFILSTLTLLSLSSFASGPSEVCQEVSRFSESDGSQCDIAISKSSFDESVNRVALSITKRGYTQYATKIMQISGGRYLDESVADACIEVSTFSPRVAVECVEVALDHAFDPNLVSIAHTIARMAAVQNAVLAIQNARNATAHPEAIEVCIEISKLHTGYGARCVSAILNKTYSTGSTATCSSAVEGGHLEFAISCLKGGGVPTGDRPGRHSRSVELLDQLNSWTGPYKCN
jgi:hypothetical protein